MSASIPSTDGYNIGSSSVDLDTLSCISTLTSDLTDDDRAVEKYGSLLLCPVCNQLLTHPVLLPCQHSVCYGCARSQILATELEENPSDVTLNTTPLTSRSSASDLKQRSRRLTSTPSESSLSRTHNGTKNGCDASPSLRIRPDSSISEVNGTHNEDSQVDTSKSESQVSAKKKSNNLRAYLPKFYSSPRGTNSTASKRQDANASAVTSQTSFLASSTPEPRPNSPNFSRQSSQRSIQSFDHDLSVKRDSVPDLRFGSPTPHRHGYTSPTFTPTSDVINSSSGSLRRSTSASFIAGRSSLRSSKRRDTNAIKRSKVSSLFCPTCEASVQLGKLGIKGLFRNFALESIVERFRSAARAAEAIRCGYCKPPAADATRSCLDCKLSYCNQCYKTVHVWGTKKAQHEFIGPTSNFSRPKVMLCPEHSNEAVTMYCNRCQHSVCKVCKSRGGHSNHPTISVKNAYKESKAQLHSLLDELREKELETQDQIERVERDVKILAAEEADVRDEIHSAIDEMHKLLEIKRTELLESADRTARTKEKDLRRTLQNLKDNVLYSSVMAFAEEVLLETDPAYFLQTYKMVETRTREAISHLSNSVYGSRDTESDNSQFRNSFYVEESPLRSLLPVYLDAEDMKNTLGALDFIKKPDSLTKVELKSIQSEGSVIADDAALRPTDIKWTLGHKLQKADYYQISYNSIQNGVDNLIESHTVPGLEFRIPPSSEILQEKSDVNLKVRAANKAGVGSWSDVTTIASKFLRRENFKLVQKQLPYIATIEWNGKTVKLKKGQNMASSIQFIPYFGEARFENGNHYWEIEATGGSDFHLLIGVISIENMVDGDENSQTNDYGMFDEMLTKAIIIGRGMCGIGEFSDSAPSSRRSSFSVENNKKSKSKPKRTPSALSALKPLKKLKNSLLRTSSISMNDLSMKSDTSRIDSQENVVVKNGSEYQSTILRSPSVTSLPSILWRERSDRTFESSTSRNVRAFESYRYFRIGIELEFSEIGKSTISFTDVSGYNSIPMYTIECSNNTSSLSPFFAVSGKGSVNFL
uniref:LOW QUALITY PROTEIN: uncharacterized protein LOC120340848 n=1 Tax=Styela clava TaxID=7725 RepID=UPI00193AAFFB|nr:LOW QUALITY PROTEIN: uncharacterized protein LOC120340848 [Styela clava]